jgi:hypothetical protein
MVPCGVPAHKFLPRVYRVASLTKRWLVGTRRDGVQQRHQEYYLDEFTFRYNQRGSRSRGWFPTVCCNKPPPSCPPPTETSSEEENRLTVPSRVIIFPKEANELMDVEERFFDGITRTCCPCCWRRSWRVWHDQKGRLTIRCGACGGTHTMLDLAQYRSTRLCCTNRPAPVCLRWG